MIRTRGLYSRHVTFSEPLTIKHHTGIRFSDFFSSGFFTNETLKLISRDYQTQHLIKHISF